MRSLPILTVLVALISGACDSVEQPLGVDEPLVVHQGAFKDGELPSIDPDSKEAKGRPTVTALDFTSGALRPGAPNVPLSGRTSKDAYAIGVQILDQGTGYWLVPVGPQDITIVDERNWALNFDVGTELEPGLQKLSVVAFDEKGRPGPRRTLEVCAPSLVPDNGNACAAEKKPPPAVASLRWNADADLDLIVIAPDGTRYSRSKFSQVVDGKVVARLDADSVSGCALDGRRLENFVWIDPPEKGAWFVYANLFDACGEPAVNFELTVYRSKKQKNGTYTQVAETALGGELLRAQTTPDQDRPLYLTKIAFP